jgi:hypothetical protein
MTDIKMACLAGRAMATVNQRPYHRFVAGPEAGYAFAHFRHRTGHLMTDYLRHFDAVVHMPQVDVDIRSADAAVNYVQPGLSRPRRLKWGIADIEAFISLVKRTFHYRCSIINCGEG